MPATIRKSILGQIESMTRSLLRTLLLKAAGRRMRQSLRAFVQVLQRRGQKSAGAIRVSFGIASNFADAWRFVQFAARFRDQAKLAIGEAAFDIESCRVIRDGS